MSHPFNPKQGSIVVDAEATGPHRSMTLRMILDTGATTTVIRDSVLSALGYDLPQVTDRVQLTTGGAVQTVPRVVLTRLTALGQHRFGFRVLAHALPTVPMISGLLGLDFLRDQTLAIDFRSGLITLV
jgi:predicted aspartyl protease